MFFTEHIEQFWFFTCFCHYTSYMVLIKIDKMSSTMLGIWSLYLLLCVHYLLVECVLLSQANSEHVTADTDDCMWKHHKSGAGRQSCGLMTGHALMTCNIVFVMQNM
jgi:hypothetical protein